MRMMIPVLAAALAVQPATAFANDDDWEFAQDARRQLTVAAVRYDDGKVVIARCQEGDLQLAVAGLADLTTGASTYLESGRADGRQDVQSWDIENAAEPGVMTSGAPARDIRFLRGGGIWRLSARAGAERPIQAVLDLPAQSANLDRVLTACQRPLHDERDALPRADALYRHRTDARKKNPARRPRIRAILVAEGSCIVRDLRFSECRIDYERARAGRDGMRAQNGRLLEGEDRDTLEGAVAYVRITTDRSVGRGR
ncbi:hypothetical protein D3C72_1350430 [compost metagenome]